MTVHLLKNNFSRGEFSPKSHSRVDLELYGGGAETLRNFIANQVGGIRRRSGSRFAGEAKYSDKLATFIPFVFSSTGDAYMLEFGHQYVRFWVSGPAQVLNGSLTPLEVATPYDHLDVADIQFTQVGDAIYLAHNDYEPRKLVRASSTSWSLGVVDFFDGPYLSINDTDTTVYVDEAVPDLVEGTTVTLVFSATTGVNDGLGLQASDVGRHLRVRSTVNFSGQGGGANTWMFGKIDAVNSTTSVEFECLRVGDGIAEVDNRTNAGGIPVGTPSKSWRLGAFSTLTGWPRCVEVFESRLVWANTRFQPRTLFFSRTGLPADYAPSAGNSVVEASHGMVLTVLAGLVDQILWLKEAPRLQIGTSSGIRTLGGSDTTQALSPTNISQRLEVNYGVSDAVPPAVGSAGIACGMYGKSLCAVYFDYRVNQIVAPDISRLHEHLFTTGVRKIVYQQVPESVLWARNGDGTIVGVTFDQEQNVAAFHRHDFGGDSIVVDVGAMPGTDRTEVWLLVSRTINGQHKVYVEVVDADFDLELDTLESAFFVDCGATYNGAATNTVSGLTHLAGESVIALVDGVVIRNLTVGLNGVLTLPDNRTGSFIHVGYAITSEFKTLRPPHQGQDGFILGRKQRVPWALVEILKTGGLKIGRNADDVATVEDRLTDTPFGEATPLKHGGYKVPIDDKFSDGGRVYGVITDPLPGYIRSLLIALDFETR